MNNTFMGAHCTSPTKLGCYLLGCHPFYFNEAMAHYWLVKVGLKDDPRIWAFDIAWEPHLVDHTNHHWRKKLDPQWTAWAADRYGSIEEAVADWGYPPKDMVKDSLPSPDPVHLQSPGPWDG